MVLRRLQTKANFHEGLSIAHSDKAGPTCVDSGAWSHAQCEVWLLALHLRCLYPYIRIFLPLIASAEHSLCALMFCK